MRDDGYLSRGKKETATHIHSLKNNIADVESRPHYPSISMTGTNKFVTQFVR